MKLFQSMREFHAITGLKPSTTDPNARVLNIYNSIYFLSMIVPLISSMGVLLYENVSYIEYTFTLYMLITCVACMANFLVSFFKIKQLYLFIEEIEKFMDTSESMDACVISR